MSKQTDFISKIAPLVQKYAPQYGIKVCSPIIAQACLESAYGTSNKVCKGKEWRHNYFGLKWRNKRCAISNDYFEEWTAEQNVNGTYTSIVSRFCKFKSLEDCVIGYFQWTNISNYANLKGVTDPKVYLENIKLDKYATSHNYVDSVMKVVRDYNLTQYDNKPKPVETPNTKSNVPFTVKILDSALNIRKGPGTSYDIVGCIKDNGIYTIVETNTKNTWGKLKSGVGWISINSKYVERR